jgi:hypothetical protein
MHDLSPQIEESKIIMPTCPTCSGRGYTRAPEALTKDREFITIAWRNGVACSCPAGLEFADNQLAWMRLTSRKMK